MYKKTITTILTTSIVLLGSNSAFAAENENNSFQKEQAKVSTSSTVTKIGTTIPYVKGMYELSIPVGSPYYLPTKLDANGNNIYTYKITFADPLEGWELNTSNGEIVCGIEGTIIVEVYDEYGQLVKTYQITAGGV
jgi:hypothetical protein